MKKYYLLFGICSMLVLTALAQGPMEVSPADNPNGPEKVHYTIKKSALSSDKHTDFGAYVSDGKLYFLSDRKTWPISWTDEDEQPFLDLFVVDLASGLKAEFAGSQKNGKLNEGPICFTKDGTRVYYTREYDEKKGEKSTDGTINLAIYTARIKSGKWIEEQELSINNVNYSVGHPVLSNNGKFLYFSSNMPGGKGGSDIYRATVESDGTVSDPQLLPGEVNTPGNELFPSIGSNDEMYFASNGHESMGGLDIFMAVNKGDKFTRVTNVGYPVNSIKDDFAYIPGSADKGYFSSNRDSTDDIYNFDQIIPFRFVPIVSGNIKLEDSKLQSGIIVEILDQNETLITSQVTDAKGNYTFDLEEEKNYIVRYSLEGYDPQNFKVSTKGAGFGSSHDVLLKKDNGVEISLKLIALATGHAVEGARVTMIDNLTNKLFLSQLSNPAGKVSAPMLALKEQDSIDLTVRIAKEGYLTKEVRFQTTVTSMQDISLDAIFGNAVKMNREGIKTGLDASYLIDIEPIYFDSSSFILNPNIRRELDKVVALMTENSSMQIKIRTHTDSRGKSTDNLTLSSKRAEAMVDYIVYRGIPSSRISGKGFGETEIVNQCVDGVDCSEKEHSENARVEFIITKN